MPTPTPLLLPLSAPAFSYLWLHIISDLFQSPIGIQGLPLPPFKGGGDVGSWCALLFSGPSFHPRYRPAHRRSVDPDLPCNLGTGRGEGDEKVNNSPLALSPIGHTHVSASITDCSTCYRVGRVKSSPSGRRQAGCPYGSSAIAFAIQV